MSMTISLGIVAQCFTSIAGITYLVRTIQGINKPNVVSWLIWAGIGWAFLLVTVTGSNTDISVKIFSVTLAVSPTLVVLVALKKGYIEALGNWDRMAGLIAIVAIGIWFLMKDDPGIIPIVMLIMADMCGIVPTLIFVCKTPTDDRPMAWIAFSFGSLLTLLSIEKWNPESYILPIWMMVGSLAVAYPLVVYRVRNKIRWREWIWVAVNQK